MIPSFADVQEAHARIRDHVHRTPVLTCSSLDQLTGSEIYLKCENLQKTGAFKFRGATNAVYSLPDDEARRGVVTHSSGNHGAALACAARTRGIPATVVMPRNAPGVKQAAVRGYGATIRFCEPTLEARERTAEAVLRETGGVLIHPFNDERIICGQATAAVELLEDVADLDAVLAPVGGGGLLSGTLIAVKKGPARREIRVVACEPEKVDDAYRSWKSGAIVPLEKTDTIADGLRTSLGEKTFAVIRELIDEIALVSEEKILEATWLLIERAKLVVEPSGAVPLAALLQRSPEVSLEGKKVGLILSGGNVDLKALPGLHDS